MSEKAALAFCDKLREDTRLQARVTHLATTGSQVDFVALGAEQGFEFDEAELKKAVESLASADGELGDAQLESVSGGWGTSPFSLLLQVRDPYPPYG